MATTVCRCRQAPDNGAFAGGVPDRSHSRNRRRTGAPRSRCAVARQLPAARRAAAGLAVLISNPQVLSRIRTGIAPNQWMRSTGATATARPNRTRLRSSTTRSRATDRASKQLEGVDPRGAYPLLTTVISAAIPNAVALFLGGIRGRRIERGRRGWRPRDRAAGWDRVRHPRSASTLSKPSPGEPGLALLWLPSTIRHTGPRLFDRDRNHSGPFAGTWG